MAGYPAAEPADERADGAATTGAAAPVGEPAPTDPAFTDPEHTAQVVEFAVRSVTAPVHAGAPTSDPQAEDEAPGVAAVETTESGSAGVDPEPALPGAPAPAARPRARRAPNKREVRHQQTREAIVDAAAALFGERGFDAVSVQQIARRAGVVEKTVFNHFPVKEGLVFEADPPMRAALVDAVRRRPAGESVAAAAGSFVVAAISQLGSPAAAEGVAEMARVVRGSRTLQVREREILGTLTDTLAEQITAETRPGHGDLEPWLAANAVLGLYSALMELARDRVLAGASGPELVEELQLRGRRGLSLLQFGLAGYAKRR